MCLTVSRFFTNRYVATQPMAVFKIITLGNLSACVRFQYVPNRLYTIDNTLRAVPSASGTEMVADEGFHAWWSHVPFPMYKFFTVKVVKFTILIGAHFYIGTNHEIVSDAIESGTLESVAYSYGMD